MGKDKPIKRIYNKKSNQRTVEFIAFENDSLSDGIWYWNDVKYSMTAYVNPYTAEVIKIEDDTLEFFNIVLWLTR